MLQQGAESPKLGGFDPNPTGLAPLGIRTPLRQVATSIMEDQGLGASLRCGAGVKVNDLGEEMGMGQN